MNERPVCHCFDAQDHERQWQELSLHAEPQDTKCAAWHRLLDLIELAARDGRTTFSPGLEFDYDMGCQIVALPPTIAKLKAVKIFTLYGSNLVRIPPEIGEMSSLEEFDPYTSYRLHWFPYEITRCSRLKRSRVSTRALYGNYKYRPPFPRLPHGHETLVPNRCSVCGEPFKLSRPRQRWISLPVATDVIPLLVHACSDDCLSRLPRPAESYIPVAHQGGLRIIQPPPR